MRCVLGGIWAASISSCSEHVGDSKSLYQLPDPNPSSSGNAWSDSLKVMRSVQGEQETTTLSTLLNLPDSVYLLELRVWWYTRYTHVAFESMNNAGSDVRGDSAICYSIDWDRLHHDRRRQTNFTLLGEPLQSRHHIASCFCQRKERDKWQHGATLLYGVSNICHDMCFIQGFYSSFITRRSVSRLSCWENRQGFALTRRATCLFLSR